MAKYLVIVESPTKIKTLRKFLGKDYEFESSIGHIRDLPEKKFGISIDQNVRCDYEVLPHKKDVVKKLVQAAKQVETVYLCPDPDREGEAIAWHIRALLPKEIKTKRVTFNSITSEEVQQAMRKPRDINLSLVDAQQARRVLDRLVGYTISPILAQRVQMGRRGPRQGSLSAGRVQSVALKLVVDREKEIESFKPQEYWNISALLNSSQGSSFKANLHSVDGKRVEKQPKDEQSCAIDTSEKAELICKRINSAKFRISTIERKEKRRFPVAPFTTSTLQQEASRHFGFSAQRTMSIAQQLYEGIEMGSDGTEGLITYMRTDSVKIAPEAQQALRHFIKNTYGEQLLEANPRSFASSKAAQEAHEAIRPTNLAHPPESIQSFLSIEQFKLYSLIWRRFIATQMKPAVYDTVQVDVEAAPGLILRATGSQIKFRGFLTVYEEKRDEDEDDDSKLLPDLKENEPLHLVDVEKSQAFTQPPARYSEASLVKALEQSGIGRPSTYAAIMNKIQGREYTVKEKGRLKPTELGRVTVQLLETSFSDVFNTQFTAQMEDELEQVACGQKDWQKIVLSFWQDFEPKLGLAKANAHVPKIDTQEICPKCGKHLQKIWAGKGYFYGCSSYPECDYKTSSEQLDFDPLQHNPSFKWDQSCPKCSSEMKVRFGPYGVFLGCTKYPECRGLINVPKAGEEALGPTQTPCPADSCSGVLVSRKSRFGKVFYSCSEYPNCDVIGNDIDEVVDKFNGRPKTPYQARAAKDKKPPATAKAVKAKSKSKKPVREKKANKETASSGSKLSVELSAIVGVEQATRPAVTKLIWDYIKSHNLQDPKDKRYILCDPQLQKVFGEPRIHMTQIAGKLGAHLHV